MFLRLARRFAAAALSGRAALPALRAEAQQRLPWNLVREWEDRCAGHLRAEPLEGFPEPPPASCGTAPSWCRTARRCWARRCCRACWWPGSWVTATWCWSTVRAAGCCRWPRPRPNSATRPTPCAARTRPAGADALVADRRRGRAAGPAAAVHRRPVEEFRGALGLRRLRRRPVPAAAGRRPRGGRRAARRLAGAGGLVLGRRHLGGARLARPAPAGRPGAPTAAGRRAPPDPNATPEEPS
ncbi:hypothetical protein KCH_12910 [Kitasatospora cheerisanensis KCTC 2395]|uniref:Uncharacterized protein n=1 Tax=Kitasatospora cheerisanensis KCTC 2395 TaxID=1348663 RepID=A0A066Z9L1_9ACTN|nr:hypothetical protein KCH_12910 [Kitasatospora cheerisanensis KCTC 2395]